MRVVIYAASLGTDDRPHLLASVAEGLRKHGVVPEIAKPSKIAKCDLAITWGARNSRARQSGLHNLIVERGYVGNRFHWTSLGLNGLNGRANFLNENSPMDRWCKHFSAMMQPRRSAAGNYVLVCGQVPGDMSLRIPNVNFVKWAGEVIERLNKIDKLVIFRPHPRALHALPLRGQYAQTKRTLEEDMAGAEYVVTFNSNSGVDAVLAGLPVTCDDMGSMVYRLAGCDPTENPGYPTQGELMRWASDIAYAQWSPEEIASGEALARIIDCVRADI